jgi:hypothetical protein
METEQLQDQEILNPTGEEAPVTTPAQDKEIPGTPADVAPPEQGEQDASPDDSGADQPSPYKKKDGFQKRIGELTKEKRQLERLVEKLIDQREPKKPEQIEDVYVPQIPRPNRYDFDTDEDFNKAIFDYTEKMVDLRVKEAVRKTEEGRKQDEIRRQQEKDKQNWDNWIRNAESKYPDFYEAVLDESLNISEPIAKALYQSSEGADLAYYLCVTNPKELNRLNSLPPEIALVELGKIGAKLQSPPQKSKKITSAPSPIEPIATGQTTVSRSPEDESPEDYYLRRTRELYGH